MLNVAIRVQAEQRKRVLAGWETARMLEVAAEPPGKRRYNICHALLKKANLAEDQLLMKFELKIELEPLKVSSVTCNKLLLRASYKMSGNSKPIRTCTLNACHATSCQPVLSSHLIFLWSTLCTAGIP